MASVGFTGTRKGLSEYQKEMLQHILKKYGTVFHHGDCIGADEQFHVLAESELPTDLLDTNIIVHPPDNDKYRAFSSCLSKGTILLPKPYLERNKDIVDACDLLIACPNPKDEINKQRSGTWSTIRYAKKQGKDIIIIT